MPSSIEKLKSLPEVNFVDKDVTSMLTEAVARYESTYLAETGKVKTLADGDPMRIAIFTCALWAYGLLQKTDQSAKYNLLRYAPREFLIEIGARVGVFPDEASAAKVTVRFSLSAVRSFAVPVKKGTRVSPGNDVFFETVLYAEVPAGSLYVDIVCKCTEAGTLGNGYLEGQIKTLVDPTPYIASVINLDDSQGGADEEDTESLREKIFLAPDGFSVAGPEDAYVYLAKKYSTAVDDVSVDFVSDGVVGIWFILTNGEIPDDTMIAGMLEYMSAKMRRPLTDKVQVSAPEQVTFNITGTYYIKSSDADSATSIQAAVNKAVTDYQLWQKTKLGRDIDPSELIKLVKLAGAKRINVTAPAFTALTKSQVAKIGTVSLTYGGLEDE